jgi:hypothetical protein
LDFWFENIPYGNPGPDWTVVCIWRFLKLIPR